MFWIILVLLSFFAGSDALAEPRQWDRDGFPVRAVRVIDDFSSVSRADGTTLLVWAQSEGSDPVIKGQLLSPTGAQLWATDGIVLAYGTSKASFPDVTAVEGGWVIVWLDGVVIYTGRDDRSDFGATGELRAIKIDDNGAPLWFSGRAGIPVSPTLDWYAPKSYTVNPSGEGAIITWHTWNEDRAQRVAADGEMMWEQPVDVPYYYESNNFASDGADGILFTWVFVSGNVRELRANKLLADGTFAWNDEDGALVHSGGDHYSPQICMDGSGGALVEWLIDGTETALVAQHLDAQGAVQWQAAGVTVLEMTQQWWRHEMAPSFSGGVVDGYLSITGDAPDDYYNLVAQKVSISGVPVWGLDGAVVCDALSDSLIPSDIRIASDQSGGALCAAEYRSIGAHYSQYTGLTRIGADETRPWNESCMLAVDSSDNAIFVLSNPQVINDIVRFGWLERSSGLDNDIRVWDFSLATGTPDENESTRITPGDRRDIQSVQIVKLNNGSTATAWSTSNGWNETSHFQIVDVFGNAVLEEDERLLCRNADGTPVWATRPELCSDGNGGFFAALRSYEEGYYLQRVVHVDGNGNFVSPPEGVELTFDGFLEVDYNRVICIADGMGGCYVAAGWYNTQFVLDVLVARLDSQCQPVWESPAVFDGGGIDAAPFLVTTSSDHAVLIGYKLLEFENAEQRIARVSTTGDVDWNISLAAHLGGSGYSTEFGACTDNYDGAFVTWIDRDNDTDIYRAWVQRISPTGELLFGEQGVLFYESEDYIRDISCSADIPGNVTMAWEQFNATDLDIYGQRVLANGTVAWLEGGVPLTTAAHDQYNPITITISDNEIYVLWNDERAGGAIWWESDIYGTHLNARGQVRDDSYWQEGGSPICNYPYFQTSPSAVADGAGGLTVAWLDARCGLGYDYSVFAQRLYDPIFTDVNEPAALPSEFSLSQNYPNPFNPSTVIEFSLPTTSKAGLKVFDVTGRLVTTLVDEQMTAGNHRAHFDGSRLSSGVYFYKLEAADRSFTRKMVLIK
ncbi:MAG: T9SS type A sorting domain-containing protein [Calditrichaeota bacterium]|nr:T9SS type A sorting domain-containing protein [Calditrichota bacterium]MCB9369163.1 T9SS type A sorting domain-containing protein [Calditrichota bacterium]